MSLDKLNTINIRRQGLFSFGSLLPHLRPCDDTSFKKSCFPIFKSCLCLFCFFFFPVVSSSGPSVIPQVCRLCNSTRGAACNWVNATCNVKNKYCYAFWTNDSHGVVVSHAGCWDQNDHCETSSCAGRKVSKKNKTAFFCCCNASFCNLDLSVATNEPTSATLTPPSVPGK